VLRKPPQGGGEFRVGKLAGSRAQRRSRRAIQLFCNDFIQKVPVWTGLHADLYSSKFPPRTAQYLKQHRSALPKQAGGGTAAGGEGKFGRGSGGNADLRGEGRRQAVPDHRQDCEFALAAVKKTRERRFGRQYLSQWAHDKGSLARLDGSPRAIHAEAEEGPP
jgi:hypothetical protein